MKTLLALILAFCLPCFAQENVPQSGTGHPLTFFLSQSADHIAGLTGASPTVTISKAGGSFASPSGSVTEIANGWYKVSGNATDTTTLGALLLHATAASGDPCDKAFVVVGYNDQDSVRLGLTAMPNAVAGSGTGLFVNGGTLAMGTVTLANPSNLSLLQIGTANLANTLISYTGNTPQTGDSYTRIGATGSGLTSLAPSATALSTSQWTNARAGYLDGLNGGVTLNASQGVIAFSAMNLGTFTVSHGSILNNDNADNPAISISGNGVGAGIALSGGASGIGLSVTGGNSGGTGIFIVGTIGNPAISLSGNLSAPSGFSVGTLAVGTATLAHASNLSLLSIGTITNYTGNIPQTGDSFARLGAPSGASIDADILTRLATASITLSTGGVIIAGYANHEDPAYLLYQNAAAKLNIDANGKVATQGPR